MKKNLDKTKSRYNEHILQVHGLSLYGGSTVPKIDVNVIKWNPENSWTPANWDR